MRQTRMLPIGANTFRIRLNRRSDGGIGGTLVGGAATGVLDFTSLSGMIIMVDSILDTSPVNPTAGSEPLPEPPNFELEILFRQNFSWQGRLKWLQEGKEATFRSVLELMVILETILPLTPTNDSEK